MGPGTLFYRIDGDAGDSPPSADGEAVMGGGLILTIIGTFLDVAYFDNVFEGERRECWLVFIGVFLIMVLAFSLALLYIIIKLFLLPTCQKA